jgi:two-component system NtrC family sensor kinase
MSQPSRPSEDRSLALARLDLEENRLWRLVLLFIILLSVGMAAASWQNLSQFSARFGLFPIAAALVAAGFSYFIGRRHQVISRFRAEAQQLPALDPSDELSHLLQMIRRSQQGYRELVDSFDDVVLAVSLDGAIQAANRAFADLLGLQFPAFVFHRLSEFVASPTLEEVQRVLPRLAERRGWSGVVELRLHNSPAARFFDCSVQAIEKDGKLTGFSIWGRDLTQQRERESRFTELFETLHEGVYFSTPDGRILDANQALVQMLGYQSRSELLATPVADLYVHPEDRPRQLDQLHRTGFMHDRELRLRRRDGNEIVCLDSSRAVYDADGRALRYQGTLVDITERRRMEAEIQQQQQFKRRLLQCFPDAILVIDNNLRYTFASARVQEVLGWSEEEIVGRPVTFNSQASEPTRLYRELLAGTEQLGSVEFLSQHRDGSWKTLRCNASRLVGPENEVVGVVASLRDVTQTKLIEQQLVQAERLAAMGHMLDGFAHELNNPLTAILGAIDLLDLNQGESSHRHLTLLKEQSRRAAEIVQNLLFFSRPPMRGTTRLNLNDLIQRTLLLQQYSLRASGITVDFLPEPSLPTIDGDGNQLMQVFLNLLINAAQAIGSCRDRGTIRVRAGSREESVWISFQDDGPGIAEGTLRNIFDPFYSTKRPGGGTGMGLSVALGIVQSYGGDIAFQPGPGSGAVFTVNLPLQPSIPHNSDLASTHIN